MMMNNIDVLIYSYKAKNIKDTLNSLFKNVSNNSIINVLLIDQNPIDREKSLKELFNLQYHHIFWDNISGPCFHKSKLIKSAKSDYLMILGESTTLCKNWDLKFIEFIKNKNIILSGNKKTKISNKNIFYIKKEYENSTNFELTNFIDRDFIFGKTDLIKSIEYPYYLKFNGEEELLSLQFFINKIDIFSVPKDQLSYEKNQPILNTYVPFSLNHNYNEVINLFKYNKNNYFDLKNNIDILNFNNFHNFDFSSLEPLPFSTNDVSYDPDNLHFNKVDARRFVARTKAIH
jgi:hypothetical protein